MFFSFGASCLDPTSPTVCPFLSFGPDISEQLILQSSPSPLLPAFQCFLFSFPIFFFLLSFSISFSSPFPSLPFFFLLFIPSPVPFPGTNLTAGCLVGHFRRALNRSFFFFHISVSVSFQRFTNEDHLAVHKHKHEMTLKFGPARTDSVIIAGICCPRSHVP